MNYYFQRERGRLLKLEHTFQKFIKSVSDHFNGFIIFHTRSYNNTHFLLLYLLCLRCLHVRQHVSKALPQKAQLKIPQETCLELCLFKITYHYRVNSMRSKCTLLGTCYLDSCDMQSLMQEHFTENSSSSARGWSKTISSVFLLGITGITMLTDKYLTSTAK